MASYHAQETAHASLGSSLRARPLTVAEYYAAICSMSQHSAKPGLGVAQIQYWQRHPRSFLSQVSGRPRDEKMGRGPRFSRHTKRHNPMNTTFQVPITRAL